MNRTFFSAGFQLLGFVSVPPGSTISWKQSTAGFALFFFLS